MAAAVSVLLIASYTLHFGGSDDAWINCNSLTPGWNYTMRLDMPRRAISAGMMAIALAAMVGQTASAHAFSSAAALGHLLRTVARPQLHESGLT